MDADLIYHIVQRGRWEEARSEGSYQSSSLDSEGFIHCSTLEQVRRVADTHFRGQRGLVLLVIQSARVRAEIRYEGSQGDEGFPHIYGPLNTDAVARVVAFETGDDGRFQLPPEISAARR
jgi:uncharacterized protein (DUF952 family)